jgi:agmatine deiminase
MTGSADSEEQKTVRLGLIQTAVSENLDTNLKKTAQKIEEAAAKGTQIICLQELYRTPYFPQQEKQDAARFAESVPGESTEVFAELAKRRGVVIVVPIFERGADGKFYNTAVTLGVEGETLGVYRKIHIPYDPLFYEKDYFEEGNLGYAVYSTPFARVGVAICYDQWFPEAARILTLKGADVIFYPTAIGWVKDYTSPDGDWLNAWKTVQRGHAIANGVHVAAVNRVGKEGELQFWGHSFVCDSFGKVLQEAGENEETLLVDVDLSKNERIRDGWGFLKNRRPDTYSPLTQK